MFCKNCGMELKNDFEFCPNCGAKLEPQGNEPNQSDFGGKTYSPLEEIPVNQNNDGNQNNYAGQNNPTNASKGAGMKKQVGFVEAVTLFFKNYAVFNARSGKSEFWWGFLFNFFASLILSAIPGVGVYFSLILLIPGLALSVRRLHDIGKEWYNLFFGLIPIAGIIILIVYYVRDSDGDNKWGKAPQ